MYATLVALWLRAVELASENSKLVFLFNCAVSDQNNGKVEKNTYF